MSFFMLSNFLYPSRCRYRLKRTDFITHFRGSGGLHRSGKSSISRRKFLADSAVTAAAFSIVPRHVLGRGFVPPSDTLNIAGVGVGGMGRANLINLASQNIVALCDVDWDYAGKAFERLSGDIEHLQARIDQPPPPD